MTQLRIREAASFLGVSDDTVRRLVETGVLPSATDDAGRRVIDGLAVAMYLREHASVPPVGTGVASSARNRWVGLVTQVRSDPVMSQVELQCGGFRVVSLMSTEAVRELDLRPGSVAVAVVKSTNVIVEVATGATQ